jgi:hypothetical protein
MKRNKKVSTGAASSTSRPTSRPPAHSTGSSQVGEAAQRLFLRLESIRPLLNRQLPEVRGGQNGGGGGGGGGGGNGGTSKYGDAACTHES